MQESAGSKPSFRLGTRWIASLAAVALIAMTVATLGVLFERSTRQVLTEKAEARVLLTARDLAHLGTDVLLDEYPELILHPMLKEMQAQQPDFELLVVADREGVILGHPETPRLGTRFVLPQALQPMQREQLLHQHEALLAGQDLIVASVPILRGDEHQFGRVVVGMNRDSLRQQVAASRRAQLIVLGILGALGAVAALLMMSHLLRPVAAIRQGLERIGQGDLESPIEPSGGGELALLAQSVNETATSLKTARQALVEKERLDHEMRLAQNIQQGLLPASELRVGPFRIRGHQTPAREVGGDYYDVFPLAGGKVGLVVADVAGKGLAGCLATSMLSAFVRAYRDSCSSPTQLLNVLDKQLRASLGRGSFVTMFYGILDTASGRLCMASAGHSPTAIYRARTNQVEWIQLHGTPLAASRKPSFVPRCEQTELALGPGDVLLQYTDGLNEAWNPDHSEQFGFERLAQALKDHGGEDASQLIAGITGAVGRWSGDQPSHDDETLLVVRFNPVPAARKPAPSPQLMDLVQRGRRDGCRLVMPASLHQLRGIREWLLTCSGIDELGNVQLNLVRTGLHEICSNIVEHGYDSTPERSLEILWLPGSTPPGQVDADTIATAVRNGIFIIIDRGRVFDVSDKALAQQERHTRGRGLGLRLIHGTLDQIRYYPGTPEGNVTLARFDPNRHKHPAEVRP